MDTFCIERGTLLDAPSVVTLENPEKHSIHCLVDVNSCVSTPFEVLLDPLVSGDLFIRGWRLDDASKTKAIALAQSVGSCSTCTAGNSAENSHVQGFRAAMNVVITNLNENDPSVPPTIQILDIQDTTAYSRTESACQSFFGMQDIVDKVNDAAAPDTTGTALGEEGATDVDSDVMLNVGDTICAEGFVMDTFCIDRGTLLDNPSVVTLENPELHSLHCLIDVNSCVTSPFEVLVDPPSAGEKYKRGLRLDPDSQQKAISLAKSVGSCTDCTATDGHVLGFRAAMKATIVDLNKDDASIPPIIQIEDIQDTTAYTGDESPCQAFFGMENLNDKLSAASANRFEFGVNPPVNNLQRIYLTHGILMMVSWGFLLPSGTLIAKFYKHRPDGLWFKMHRAIQSLGLLCAIIGWSLALHNFNVFKDFGFVSFRHGICGMVVMVLGLLQPLNALIRPHGPEGDEPKSTKRKAWEIWHKSSGWIAVALAIPTIALGTLSLPKLDDQTRFQIGYGVGCGGALLLLVAYMFYDKKNYTAEEKEVVSKEQAEVEA